MNTPFDKQKLINEILNGGNVNKSDFKNAASRNNAQDILNSLSPADAEKVKEILNDKNKLNSLLSSEDAKKILKMFMNGGKSNG